MWVGCNNLEGKGTDRFQWAILEAAFISGMWQSSHSSTSWQFVAGSSLVYRTTLTYLLEQAEYAASVAYGPAACSIKLTLLLIFTRLFVNFQKMVIFTYIVMIAMVSYYLTMMVIKIRICTATAGSWNPQIQSTCFNEPALFLADTLMSVVTDFLVLLIPLPLIWKLNLPLKKRLKVIALLCTGAIAAATSIIQLVLWFIGDINSDRTVTFLRFNVLG